MIFPGKRESRGILDDRIKKIPTTITIQPIKNNGASVFIFKYIIQDEVVNGNVPAINLFRSALSLKDNKY